MCDAYDPASIGLSPEVWMKDEVLCNCPFHKETSPSFSFNLKTGVYYCFGCGAAGSAFELASFLGGDIIMVSSHDFAASELPLAEPQWMKVFREMESAVGNSYLHSRGVYDDQIDQYGIGVHEGNIVFPIVHHDQSVRGVNIRVLDKDTKSRYIILGEKPFMLDLQGFLNKQMLAQLNGMPAPVIVEGVFGQLNLRKYGIPAFALLGSSPHRRLDHAISYATFAFDNDDAGILAASKCIAAFSIGQNVQAIYPGVEADELTRGEALAVYNREIMTTHDVRVMSSAHSNPRKCFLAALDFQVKAPVLPDII